MLLLVFFIGCSEDFLNQPLKIKLLKKIDLKLFISKELPYVLKGKNNEV